ncbi:MAG: polyisoprenoid-binding protein [candidate division Zixibacteria bacterium]|nr:polyisoprenoid-binding protein [candidate division Zixibacteria bacterium]
MAAFWLFAGVTFGAEKFTIDQTHSSVGFSVKHLVITNVKGSFTNFSGTIMYDAADIAKSSVSVTINAESINTNDEGRDKHLRSADFFEVEKYPEITFVSTKIEKTENGLVAHGNLTMHGVTKVIAIPFEIAGPIADPWGKSRMGIEASLTIDRKDFGITWNKVLDSGGLTVGNEVKIELNIAAIAG